MKKIAILTPGFLPVPALKGGAIEVLINDIIDSNEEHKKYNIDLYTCDAEGLDEYNYENTNLIIVKSSKIKEFMCRCFNKFNKILNIKKRYNSYAIKLSKMIKLKKYDYILIENNMYVYEEVYNRYNYLQETKLIFHLHNNIGKNDNSKPEHLCKLIARTAYKILVVSNYLKEEFYKLAPNNNLEVLYNCVDLSIFDKKINDKKMELRKKFNLTENDFVYVYTGRIVQIKGIIELINGFKKMNLKNTNKNYKLLIVGGNLESFELDNFEKKVVLEAKDNKNIILKSFVMPNEIPQVLAISDVVIIPSRCDEAFGVVAIEAMAMGKPVIATKSGGIVEPLDETCAILIENDSNIESSLCSAMKKMSNNDEIINKFGNNGYKKVHSIKEFNKNYYFDNFVKKINDV